MRHPVYDLPIRMRDLVSLMDQQPNKAKIILNLAELTRKALEAEALEKKDQIFSEWKKLCETIGPYKAYIKILGKYALYIR